MEKNNNEMNNDFFATNKMLDVLYKRKLHIAILTLLGLVAGAIFSGPNFITPRFKSVATLYPSNISSYSEESETEQYMQWLTSSDIKDSIIEKYNLYNHYGINPDAEYSYSEMLFVYDKNIKCEQTVYDAVQITVFDKDPKVAYNIVNSIIELTDNKIRRAQLSKFAEVVPNARIMVDIVRKEIDSLSSCMGSFSDKKTSLLSSPEQMELAMKLHSANELNVEIMERYLSSVADASRNFTYSNIISPAFVADKKALPIRWVIVLFAGLGMLLLSYVCFLIAENFSVKNK